MRVSKYAENESAGFQKIARPAGGRFRQTTVRKRTTRADLVRQAERVRAELEG
jgi:hypothetical protein